MGPRGFEPRTFRLSGVETESEPKKEPKPEIEPEKQKEPKELLFDDIDLNDFILFWTKERDSTTEKRAKVVYRVLAKVLKGKPVNLESLRQGFHNTTNPKDYVTGVRVLLSYLKFRKLMDRSTVEEILEQPFLKPVETNVEEVPEVAKPEADQHIKEVADWIKIKWDEDTLMLYKLMVYTGLRLEHAIRVLESFDPNKLEFKDNMARYPTSQIGTKTKRSFYIYFPKNFAKTLRKLEQKLDVGTWENRINPSRWKFSKEEKEILPVEKIKSSWVNAKNIRKYFENLCKRYKVEELYREYFIGHSIAKIIKHYEQFDQHSWEEYKKIVDKFPI